MPSPPTKMPTYWPGVVAGDDVVRDHGVVDQPAVDRVEPDRGGAARAHAEPVAVDRPGPAGADLDEVVVVARRRAAARDPCGWRGSRRRRSRARRRCRRGCRTCCAGSRRRARTCGCSRATSSAGSVESMITTPVASRRCPSPRPRRPRRRRRCRPRNVTALERRDAGSSARRRDGHHAEAADDDPLRAGDRQARRWSRPRSPASVRSAAAPPRPADRDRRVGARRELDRRRPAAPSRQCRRQLGVGRRRAACAAAARGRCERGRGEQQRGQEQPALHSVPYMRSPASPRPGTMKPTSFRRSSSAATQSCASGCSSRTRAMPSGAAISAAQRDVARAGLAAERRSRARPSRRSRASGRARARCARSGRRAA